MSMLRHQFSNERGGGVGALNHLPLSYSVKVCITFRITHRGPELTKDLLCDDNQISEYYFYSTSDEEFPKMFI